MTTLSDAEPGDTAIVALKISPLSADSRKELSVMLPGFSQLGDPVTITLSIDKSCVRSIEKAPKPLKVGDRVIYGCSPSDKREGTILAIADRHAWVSGASYDPYTLSLDDLTRV